MVGWVLRVRWCVVTVMLCMVCGGLLPLPLCAAPVAHSGQVLPELYFVTAPKRRYRELRLLQAEGGGRYAQEMLRNLQHQALELGADAVIRIERTITETGRDYVFTKSRHPQFHVTGVAIQWAN